MSEADLQETWAEVNFDGLVGPTHHYGGLSTGNFASLRHRWAISRPREAALQGLAKMELLAGHGIPQAVLPPQDRPALTVLRSVGFSGSDEEIIRKAWKEEPELLSACFSASSMWTANAATVTPARDAEDGRTHMTPANLVSMFHRSIEPGATGAVLRRIFSAERHFAHHDFLPPGRAFSDEGAANHTRLSLTHNGSGIHLFVYGFVPSEAEPALRFPARQSLDASRAVARLHRIRAEHCLFVRQAPEAIEAGMFHNDVAAVGNERLFLYHEQAFAKGHYVADRLAEMFSTICGGVLHCCKVPTARVSLEEAVRTYLFNSQLITLPDQTMMLLAPQECRDSAAVAPVIEEWVQDEENPIARVNYVNLRESMRNGGGPACLRLRVLLSPEQRQALSGRVMLTPDLADNLADWIRRNYRETLAPPDLVDPALMDESRRALDELTFLLNLGSIYAFQR